VDIEPEILTPLLDKLISNQKIIYSICPGAGGYDSIVIMGNNKVSKDELISEINKIINEFNEKNKIMNIKANILEVNISKDFGTLLY
jgi:phosphomevalonate kinase